MEERSRVSTNNITIREFGELDYPGIVSLHNSIRPRMMETLEERQHKDSVRFSNASLHRWVAEIDGEVVALCQYQHDPWDYHPKRFDFTIKVLPSHQGRGIGSLLYDFIIAKMLAIGRPSVFSWLIDDDPKNARFLTKRGFTEVHRNVFSKIDMKEWRYDDSLDRAEELEKEGVLIMALREFMERAGWDEKIYDLEKDVAFDTPGVRTIPDFEAWKKETFNLGNLVSDGYFLAVKGDMVVGTTNVYRSEANNALEIGFTAVRRECRGKGIATTLKLRSMLSAMALGVRYLITDNEENNKAILDVNGRLGFRRVSDWVKYEKDLGKR